VEVFVLFSGEREREARTGESSSTSELLWVVFGAER